MFFFFLVFYINWMRKFKHKNKVKNFLISEKLEFCLIWLKFGLKKKKKVSDELLRRWLKLIKISKVFIPIWIHSRYKLIIIPCLFRETMKVFILKAYCSFPESIDPSISKKMKFCTRNDTSLKKRQYFSRYKRKFVK